MTPAPRGGGDAITLSGPPHNTAAVVPHDLSRDKVVPVSISVAGQSTIYRAVVRSFGSDGGEMRLRLPRDTPPGTYKGESTIGGKQLGIVVEVEPVMRIRVLPKQTVLEAAASSSVEFGLTVRNAGNVPFDVPKGDVLDFDDAVEQERALGRSLRAPLKQGESRVDRFFDELRASHGGEARVTVKSGAGRLAPGESRELACVLDVPGAVQPGRTYAGTWQFGNTGHVILAEIIATGRPKNGRTQP